MQRNYATLFDKNYLRQGMALFLSLKQVAGDFRLFVLCMDGESHDLLLSFGDPSLVPVKETEMRAAIPELERHKGQTSHGQYCWSCQPFSLRYLMQRFSLPEITYLEADSAFFSSPEPIFQEIGGASASLVAHRYTPAFDQTETSGRYCVQFNFFRNNESGLKILDYWEKSCLQYSKEHPLSYPGQTNLDQWPGLFGEAVRDVSHLGAGVAPWNVQQYAIESQNGVPTVDGNPVIFYHYHEFSFLEGGGYDLTSYPLPSAAIDAFYRPYARILAQAVSVIEKADSNFRYCKTKKTARGWRAGIQRFKRRLRGRYNVYQKNALD